MKTGVMLIVALILFGSGLALARGQTGRASTVPPRAALSAPSATPAVTVTPSRVQRLTFDDDYVDGVRDLGDGDLIGESRPVKHTSLVRPRVDFIPELIKSADDI